MKKFNLGFQINEMEEDIDFTITICSEKSIGILNRILLIFSKRLINIENLIMSSSETNNINRYIITVKINPEQLEKVIKQIEKQIGVIKVNFIQT